MRKRFSLAIAALLTSVFIGGGAALGAGPCNPAPEITRRLPRYSHGWVGSVCWLDNVIYEVTDSTTVPIMKNAETGATIGTLPIKGVPTAIQGISYDPWHDTWWIKPHQIHEAWEFTWAGNSTGRKISTRSYALQVYVDPDEENVIWVGQSVDGGVLKINLATNALLQAIPTNFGVRSVVRMDDYFWCTRAGEVGDSGVLIKINGSGQEICRYYMPVTKYDHDTGGCSIDDEGQLWVEGGKESNIYRIDVGYDPVVATPTPAPTPTPPVTGHIDSGDYDGDGTSEIAVFRPASGLWAIRGLTRAYFGPNELPVCGDYDGDGTSDIAVFRSSSARWSVRGITRFFFGSAGDFPLPGNYTSGDRAAEAAVFRRTSGLWAVRGVTRFYWGGSGDLPVPGYYAAGNVKRAATFRLGTGRWAVRGVENFYFGSGTDTPVVADFSGDGIDDSAIFRPASGLWAVRGWTRQYFGGWGDTPVPAAYAGGAASEIAVYRPSTGRWLISGGASPYFGAAADLPVAGPACNPSSAGVI